MIPLVGNNMKSIESILFEDYQVEPAALMEVAGRSVAEQVVSLANPKTVGVVAGKGNNGGDALTCARFLLDRGINVKVFSLESSVRLTYLLDEGAVVCKDIKQLQDCDVLVDGLFGYGFRPPAGEAYATLINEMNALSLPVVSIDMPSGLSAEGMVEEPIVQAELTVFLGLPKVNAVTGLGLMRSGRFVLDSLGYGRFFESHAESLAYSIEST
nr:NAD(P)H-hydrate epimerase [Coprothermobacter proteolyticus]